VFLALDNNETWREKLLNKGNNPSHGGERPPISVKVRVLSRMLLEVGCPIQVKSCLSPPISMKTWLQPAPSS